MKIKLIGAALVLAGAFLGTYATLSGNHTDAPAAQPASLTVSAAPAQAAVVKPMPSAAETEPPKAMLASEVLPRVPVTLHALSAPSDALTLAREIQLQLRRVGCYQGAISGVWSPAVIGAMKAFADHVNAILPVEHPDIILLALVQNHRGSACGASCSTGQARAGDGRCLPQVLMAGTAKKMPPADADLIGPSVPMPSPALGPPGAPLAGKRMSLGASTLAVEKHEALRKNSAKQPSYVQVRASEARQRAVNPYSRHPRWAARAFTQP